jgi:nucleoside-diphosphate-sugar epimerase
MRVLVTGATGFVGAPLMRALARHGHVPVAALRRHDTNPGQFEQVVWDLADAGEPASSLSGIDAIVHAAQSRNYRAFPGDAPEMFRINVAGTCNLLDYAARAGISRFCLLSSGTVYEPYLGGMHEEAALAPTSFLGATKLASEILARPYEKSLSLSILRLFFPYGRGQRDRLVPDIIGRVRGGKPVQLSADGEGLRLCPTYVEDIADVIVAAVAEGWSGVTNVASPQVVSLRDLAQAIGEAVGRLPAFEVDNRPSLHVVPALDRLKARYEMSRFTPLASGLREVVAELVHA